MYKKKEVRAPHYLIDKMKRKINELIFNSTVCRYRKMGDSIILTDDQHLQIMSIAKKNYCRIDKIDNQTDWVICSIPKAFQSSANTSSLVIQQLNEFCSSLSMKKISTSHGSIEIYLASQTISIPVRSN
jgi:hypothetical protein